MVEDSGRNIGDFEYTRRFFCRALPTQLDDNDSPTLIIQSYYVHQDNYALRVRLKAKSVRIAMTPDLDPLAVLEKYRDEFRLGSVTVKGPSVEARDMRRAAIWIRASQGSSSNAADT